MNIGTVIKKLRQERGMVQEQVAEYLNVSTQAVSRWETGSALPDITQVPAIANLFNCSADMLLGVDITLKKEHIRKIEKEANNYLYAGKYEEAEKILRDALKEYPNNYELMGTLALTLGNIASHGNDKAKQKALREEEIALSEKIYSECTDDMIRHNAILRLCHAYCTIGENEKAMDLAKKMPTKCVSNESLFGYILKGTEKFKHKQKEIAHDMTNILRDIMYLNDSPLDGEIKAYNLDESMLLYHKIIDIINILCEDRNFGNFNSQLSDIHLRLYYSNIQKKDNDVALKHFKLAAKHAILFDAIPKTADEGTEEYTSLLFRGMKVGNMKYIEPHNSSFNLLKRIESGCASPSNYYTYFPTAELKAIKEELMKYVNPKNIYLLYQ